MSWGITVVTDDFPRASVLRFVGFVGWVVDRLTPPVAAFEVVVYFSYPGLDSSWGRVHRVRVSLWPKGIGCIAPRGFRDRLFLKRLRLVSFE